MGRGAFHSLPYGDSATRAPRKRSTGNKTEDKEMPRRVGGGSAPYARQRYDLHMQGVPIPLPLVRVGVSLGKYPSRSGAHGEAPDRVAVNNL